MKSTLLLVALALAVALASSAQVRIGSGVNLSGMEFASSAKPGVYGTNYILPTTNEVDYYYGKGLRNFRLPFLWERMQPTLGAAFDTTYFNRYDSLVQYIIGKNASVIIDPHNYARFNGGIIGASGSGVTTANFVSFWKTLAAKYKANADFVLLGLMNEPHGMSSKLWFSTAQSVITGLRAAGITNTILVPGNAYTGAHSWNSTASWISTDSPVVSNAALALTLTDSLNNLVWEVHQYFDSDSSGTSETCVTGTARFDTFLAWLEANDQYGYVGEFAGAANADCKTVVTAALAKLKTSTRIIGTSWWGGGPWWGNYMYAFEASGLTSDVAQMSWQTSNLIPSGRYSGYNPVSRTTPNTAVTSPDGNSAASVAVSWLLVAASIALFVF